MAQCANPRIKWTQGDAETWTRPRSPSLWTEWQFRCGHCAPCLLSKAGQWAVRLTLEGYCHKVSTSLLLTYADEHLPPYGSLCFDHLYTFRDSLRKRVARRGGDRISFDMVGEYSPRRVDGSGFRPHYHLAIFGYWPPDAVPLPGGTDKRQLFTSKEIDDLWGKGRATFQEWSYGAAAYISGHQSAKLTASKSDLAVRDRLGNVIGSLEPEFHRPSTGSGIGRKFFERYADQLLANGFTVAKHQAVSLPNYFMRLAKESHPELYERLSEVRRAKALEVAARPGPPAGSVEAVAQAKIKRMARDVV